MFLEKSFVKIFVVCEGLKNEAAGLASTAVTSSAGALPMRREASSRVSAKLILLTGLANITNRQVIKV